MIKAHEDGAEWGASLAIGQQFKGAMPAAVDAGYPQGSPDWRAFIGGALTTLPAGVTCNTYGVILKLG